MQEPIKSQRLGYTIKPQELKDAATQIRALYTHYKVNLDPKSAVGHIVMGAENVPHKDGTYLETTVRNVFESFAVINLRKMLEPIENHPRSEEFLRVLVKGSLSSYAAGPSRAKDILWELAVCSRLRRAGLNADLKEPPDIVWTQDDKVTGISCKKLYGDGRVQAAISKGVEQLACAGPYGILAINIDEYVPHEKTLTVRTVEHAGELPNRIVEDFSRRHHRHIQKYYDRGRLSGVIIGLTCRTTIDRGAAPPNFFTNIFWQATTSRSLPWEHQRRLFRLARWIERTAEREGHC